MPLVAERLGCRAVLLNPAVDPARDLARYIGEQTAWHDPDERFFFEPRVRRRTARARARAAARSPERYFAVIAKGDEVLDWREMTARYPGARVKLLEGGDHALSRLRRAHRGRDRAFLELARLSTAAWDNRAHVCIVRRSRQVPGRPRDVRGRSSSQVELDSGKRVKVKAANVLLKFDKPAPAELLREAQALAAEIELDLAWEFAPEEEFGFADLARDYFSDKAGAEQQAAALLAPVRGAALLPPRRQGPLPQGARGNRAAGAARHREEEAGRRRRSPPGPASWPPATARRRSASSCTGSCSSRTRTRPSTRRWSRRRARTQRAPLDAAASAPARSTSPYQFHWRRFLFENFPEGHGVPAARARRRSRTSCRSPTSQAFSIDDSQHHRDRRCAVGAGPGQRHRHASASTSPRRAWPSQPGSADRPGGAPAAVHGLHAGLQDHDAARRRGAGLHAAGRPRLPGRVAVRDASTRPRWRCKASETRLERVPIAVNLRHDQLDARRHRGMARRGAQRRRDAPGRAPAARRCRSCTGWRSS